MPYCQKDQLCQLGTPPLELAGVNVGRITDFKDDQSFFAIYPTKTGPQIYFEGKQLSINKNLLISLIKNGERRKFVIDDFNIEINYTESPYIGFDIWSDEIDVDLFYMIEQLYKNDDFYERYTL